MGGLSGLIAATLAGFVKTNIGFYLFQKYNCSVCAFIGIPLPGSVLTFLSFVCLYPFLGAFLGLRFGESLGNKITKIFTQKPIQSISVHVIQILGGIICGIIAAFLLAPLGSE